MCRNTASSTGALYDLPSSIGFSVDPRCWLCGDLDFDLSGGIVDDLRDDLDDDQVWDLSGDAGDDPGYELGGDLGDDVGRRLGCASFLVRLLAVVPEVGVAQRTLTHS